MKITYIYHSGFLAETKECYYLFDYYKGVLPLPDREKPVYVFASHGHQDHYNPEVFSLLRERGMKSVTAVLAKDIPSGKYPQEVNVIRAYGHQSYLLENGARVETLISTDAGVAFLVSCSEGVFYHAGDLNDWVWAEETEQYNRRMTGSYRHEIDLLRNRKIDIAFLPLDPRQEKAYARGILYFLKNIRVNGVYPMHYWEKPQIIDRFLGEYPEYKDIVRHTETFHNPLPGLTNFPADLAGFT